ncbi:SGNH/GDSL hydrolase family protein [Aeromicrobium fastidiosum]|uniref:SGNH/GDSL hydrolase family protein n=1 Tax=Aeromicrobium fastidiosum TaxID=52699 RepID=A0A641ARL4_9ACTN|nr:SGNH/GDSL hydrolase family protein [Aeromicrobium fastidiosum]KAA1380756.1 SGNH/GDSL hydrolase family protein [Aeromicrobium fastidiosum]MBP2390375.1 lysophospholipase L1-like esterase [Aeromicrobium fastidiosum]
MPTPLPLPIRVLVKGASTVNWVSFMGGPRQDFIFPRVVEEQLLAAGRPCDVQTSTMTSQRTSTILSTWQAEVLGYSPDVIVLVYGHYETIHLFIPRWLEVHANSLKARPRRIAAIYRRAFVRPAWKALARLQAKVDSILDPTLRRGRPEQVAADLRRYIDNVQKVGSPLVYVFELLPPGSRYRSWFPGMARRIDVMNQTLERMVADVGLDHVRYFRVAPLVDQHAGGDIDVAIPDGFHYSPEMHRHIGTALAADVEQWAATQNHLSTGPERP